MATRNALQAKISPLQEETAEAASADGTGQSLSLAPTVAESGHGGGAAAGFQIIAELES